MTRFVDDILPLTAADYVSAGRQMLAALRPNPEVLGVARFGQVKDPGISDLDLLIVVDDGAVGRVGRLVDETIRRTPHGSYLYFHPPTIAPRSLLPVVGVLHSLGNLEALHERDGFGFGPPSPDRVDPVHAVVWTSQVRTGLPDLLAAESVGARYALLCVKCALASVANYCTLLGRDRQAGIARRAASAGRDAFRRLTDWAGKADCLARQASEAQAALLDVEWALQAHLRRTEPALPGIAERRVIQVGREAIVCTPDRSEAAAPAFYGSFHELINCNRPAPEDLSEGLRSHVLRFQAAVSVVLSQPAESARLEAWYHVFRNPSAAKGVDPIRGRLARLLPRLVGRRPAVALRGGS